MPVAGPPCDDRSMPDAAAGTIEQEREPRKLYRSSDGRWLGGVARGLAGHLGLPVFWVRLAFVALFVANGLGALLYAAFWSFVPLGVGGLSPQPPSAPAKADRGQLVALLALLVASMVFVASVDLNGTARAYLFPALLVGAGVAVVWRQADNARRARWAEAGLRRRNLTLARSAAGVLLVGAGVSGMFVLQGSAEHLGAVLQASLAVLVGVALLAGPWLVRMAQDLGQERLMRIRAQERAEVAAHVHDSVLHTLTLIQRNADRPAEVRRLARSQERELRNWLHRPEGSGRAAEDGPATLAEAVKRTAAEVEDKHGVPLEVVLVGDCPLDEPLPALVQAAREAMVNAAKYGGEGGPVQVFAEAAGEEVFVSVRDRGPGFDLDAVPADRMGVRESIIGRMERHGGTARLRSAPDGGTEVELEIRRTTAG
ncbi:nitrate/nitrite sensor protein NarQ [Streptomyces sp. ADI98-12]|uniref:Two-component system sensor histidine kinase n=4 Tax=Streptomyces TaxID=1883 RepID=A0A380PAD7_STRGR|nr:nitrate/nitrite sensor protein NarQ [Streptomyces sp. ADI98-12]SUP62201.1 Two-component system sensor histidine kinase [Streptomyces griseus]